MKRKVIQIANSTQLISLPRKWSLKYGVKKGDEIEVEENGNKILISTEKPIEQKKIEMDVTGLDRTCVLLCLQGLYRKGYDEITVKFNQPTTIHFRLNEEKKLISIIHEVVNRLTGFEIIQERENFCIIKELSHPTIEEFDNALRRVFLLLIDASKDLVEGTKNLDLVLVDTIEEKHDTITKFVSYCLRLLNKGGYPNPKNSLIVYHFIANLDKITDVLKYSARDMLKYKHKVKKETKKILDEIHNTLLLYYDFFYKFELIKATKIYENRDKILKDIRTVSKKLPQGELLYLNNMSSLLELITDAIEARIAIEF